MNAPPRPSGDLLWKFLLGLTSAAIISIVVMLWSHERRISNIESTRFTRENGSELERTIMGNVPPLWFQRRVDGLEARLETRMDLLQDRLEAGRP